MHYGAGEMEDEERRGKMGEWKTCMACFSALVAIIFFTVCFSKVDDY